MSTPKCRHSPSWTRVSTPNYTSSIYSTSSCFCFVFEWQPPFSNRFHHAELQLSCGSCTSEYLFFVLLLLFFVFFCSVVEGVIRCSRWQQRYLEGVFGVTGGSVSDPTEAAVIVLFCWFWPLCDHGVGATCCVHPAMYMMVAMVMIDDVDYGTGLLISISQYRPRLWDWPSH